ncbi:MAG: DUF3551 domain-containing protein [Xanthobacteraceae bacterium]
MIRIAMAVAASATIAFLNVSAARAQTYGNAPWCAVREMGSGEVQWDCNYSSATECAPTVTAGNRGTCNLNPYFARRYPDRPGPAPRHRHYHRHHYAPYQ